MFAPPADAPNIVVQVTCTATRHNFRRQYFIVKKQFAAGYFGIPNTAVRGKCAEFTYTGFNVVINRPFRIKFIHRYIVIAVEFTGFQIYIRLNLADQFPVFIQFGAQPKFSIKIAVGIFWGRIAGTVVCVDVLIIHTYAECAVNSQQIIEDTDFIVVFTDNAARIDIIVGSRQ